jgi:hypothetical protein
LGRNLIEIFGWKDSPKRMMVAINHKHDTLSELTINDVIELKKAGMTLSNKKDLTGNNCKKNLQNKLEKQRKFNKVQTTIKID